MNAPAQFLDVAGADGAVRKIAYMRNAGTRNGAPGVLWLCGFNSEMTSTKASVLAPWTEARGSSLFRFDYSGHGRSGGRLQDFTISEWLDEAVEVFTRLTTGRQVIVGSSMGGWLALLLTRKLRREHPAHAARIRALVLIAPAWDMTEELMWKQMSAEMRAELERDGVYLRPSTHGAPYAISRALIEDGRAHLLGQDGFDPGCPVRILHGMRDVDVPWQHGLRLVELLGVADIRLTLVKDGEHRLSRASDLALLFAAIEEFVG